MASLNPIIPTHIAHYVSSVITRETDVQKRLRAETAKLPLARMQITADQGAFLGFMLRLMRARNVIEVGTFTGYSALSMAMALPEDGKLIACDVSTEWTNVAKRYWKEAGVNERIDLRIAPAQETLSALTKHRAGDFDFAFIDADKTGYDAYYELCLSLLKPGGVIAFDNTLWSGKVADNTNQEEDTEALRVLNAKIRDDNRVSSCLLTIADGITMALRI